MIEQYASQRNLANKQKRQTLNPQQKIYNRYFYLRNAHQQQLQQQFNRQIRQLSEKPKISPSSYSILVQKFEKQLTTIIRQQVGGKQVDFESFQTIICRLGNFDKLIKQKDKLEHQHIVTQFWLILIDYNIDIQTISQSRLEMLMHILFCPCPLKKEEAITLISDIFSNLEENRQNYINEYPQTQDQVINLQALVKKWLDMKIIHFSQLSKEKQKITEATKHTFKPQINEKSKQYADQSLRKYLSNNKLDNLKNSKLNQLSGYISGGKQLSYHQILYRRGLEKQQFLKTSRDQIVISDKEKTLTNDQAKKLVENLYIVKQKRQDLDYQKIKQEEQLKLCTFRPQTTEYQKRNKTPIIKNYQKDIERLQKGRNNKLKLKQAYQNLGRVKKKSTGPPSFVEREKPRLILEIKAGDRIEQIKLRGDQEPHLVAKKFVHRYGLQESMIQVLEAVIQEQLAAL